MPRGTGPWPSVNPQMILLAIGARADPFDFARDGPRLNRTHVGEVSCPSIRYAAMPAHYRRSGVSGGRWAGLGGR